MTSCDICLEPIKNNPYKSKDCSCNIYYHKKCYNIMKQMNNISCGFCRKKIIPDEIDIYIDADFMNYILNIFHKYPNIITFILFMIISFLLSLFYIIPLLTIKYSYYKISRYINNFFFN
jgi:hypothetical protein